MNSCTTAERPFFVRPAARPYRFPLADMPPYPPRSAASVEVTRLIYSSNGPILPPYHTQSYGVHSALRTLELHLSPAPESWIITYSKWFFFSFRLGSLDLRFRLPFLVRLHPVAAAHFTRSFVFSFPPLLAY